MKKPIDLEKLKEEYDSCTYKRGDCSCHDIMDLIELLEEAKELVIDYRSSAQEMAADALVSNLDAWLARFQKEGEK